MSREGHQCPVGTCTNWVQFADERVCFEHTAPFSPGGCGCEGCQPPPPPRPTRFYCFMHLDGQCDDWSLKNSIYCEKHHAEVHGPKQTVLVDDWGILDDEMF